MVNYVCKKDTGNLIQKVCEEKGILILYKNENTINIQEYLKTTKINFNLIKYFFIELSNLDNKETEIVESISNFCKLYLNTRVIILAQGFNEQSEILNKLYEIGIYNIINSTEEAELEKEILKALSEDGIQKKEAKRFKKLEEVKEQKSNKLSKIKKVIQKKNKKEKKSKQINDTLPKEIEGVQVIHQSGGVYFFAILLEAMTRLVKLICYIAIFLLTSVGLTILMNAQLREMIFKMFG